MNNVFNSENETHPLKPFISSDVKAMMVGSFPPVQSKWTMEFYYPNFQNDMWRIFGLAFYNDKEFFVAENKKSFDVNLLKTTLIEKRIGVGDMGRQVIRLKNNASDKFLQIVEPLNVSELLSQMPFCNTFIATGDKAAEALRLHFSNKIKHPPSGGCVSFSYKGRELKLYRMPSSSRAYPLPLAKKAEIYKQCFEEVGLLQ